MDKKFEKNFHCNEEDAFRNGHDVRSFEYKNYSISSHDHDFYEMNIILRGKGIHRIENADVKVRSGDVLVIPPHTVHSYSDTESLDVHHIIMKHGFVDRNRSEAENIPGFLRFFEIEPYLRAHFSEAMFLHLSGTEMMWLGSELEVIADNGEFDSDELYPLKCHAVWSLIYRLCCLLVKQQRAGCKCESHKYENQIMAALDYIHGHYDEKITIEKLCEMTYLSRSTFLRGFDQMCGTTPTEYIGDYRRRKAMELMSRGGISKTEIAHFCGYYDLSHMERALKE